MLCNFFNTVIWITYRWTISATAGLCRKPLRKQQEVANNNHYEYLGWLTRDFNESKKCLKLWWVNQKFVVTWQTHLFWSFNFSHLPATIFIFSPIHLDGAHARHLPWPIIQEFLEEGWHFFYHSCTFQISFIFYINKSTVQGRHVTNSNWYSTLVSVL